MAKMQTFAEPGTSGYPNFELGGYRYPRVSYVGGTPQPAIYSKNKNRSNQQRVQNMFNYARTSGTGKFRPATSRVGSHMQTQRQFNAESKKRKLNQHLRNKAITHTQLRNTLQAIQNIPEFKKLNNFLKSKILAPINARLESMSTT